MLKFIFTFLALAINSPATSETSRRVLPFEPAVVSVKGTLTRRVYPGPPNFESVRSGDESHRIWILSLEEPIDVAPGDAWGQANVKEIQLAILEKFEGFKEEFGNWTNKPIECTGGLYPGQFGNHHLPVLLGVSKCNRATSK